MAVHKRTTMLAHCNLKQNMWLCSKQSSFFPFMHCPLVANQKTWWSIGDDSDPFDWSVHIRLNCKTQIACNQAFWKLLTLFVRKICLLLKWETQVYIINLNYFKKWAIPGLFFFILSFQYTVESKQMFFKYEYLSMTGFEPRTSGIRSNSSTNWATTTAQ